MTQLSLEQPSLVGKSWWHEKHGRCEVIAHYDRHMVGGETWYWVQVRALGGHRRYRMLWPANVVRGELASPTDVWVGDNSSGFVNGTEHLRLAGLGLTELDPHIAELVRVAATPTPTSPVVEKPLLAEAQHEAGPVARRKEVSVAMAEKPAASKKALKLNELSRTALKKRLLEVQTIPDGAWAPFRAEHDLPGRETGESRSDYIKRVL